MIFEHFLERIFIWLLRKNNTSVGLSLSKSDEIISKFSNSDYSLEQIKDIENLADNENEEIIIVSGEDLNLDLFKRISRKLKKLIKK